MSKFHLSIITPNKGRVFDDDVEKLQAPGQLGSFGVLANHAPMISALNKGSVKINDGNQENTFNISAGVLEVDGKHDVLILADSLLEDS